MGERHERAAGVANVRIHGRKNSNDGRGFAFMGSRSHAGPVQPSCHVGEAVRAAPRVDILAESACHNLNTLHGLEHHLCGNLEPRCRDRQTYSQLYAMQRSLAPTNLATLFLSFTFIRPCHLGHCPRPRHRMPADRSYRPSRSPASDDVDAVSDEDRPGPSRKKQATGRSREHGADDVRHLTISSLYGGVDGSRVHGWATERADAE